MDELIAAGRLVELGQDRMFHVNVFDGTLLIRTRRSEVVAEL